MLNIRGILVSGPALLALAITLAGCGQKGPLYIPTGPAAAHRATLIDTLVPDIPPSRSHTAPSPNGAAAPAAAEKGTRPKETK